MLGQSAADMFMLAVALAVAASRHFGAGGGGDSASARTSKTSAMADLNGFHHVALAQHSFGLAPLFGSTSV